MATRRAIELGRLQDDKKLVRAVANAVLYDLEDRRDVKQPLNSLKYGDAIDRRIYNEIRTAIGTLALGVVDRAMARQRKRKERDR